VTAAGGAVAAPTVRKPMRRNAFPADGVLDAACAGLFVHTSYNPARKTYAFLME
jgi:hypothetical protein